MTWRCGRRHPEVDVPGGIFRRRPVARRCRRTSYGAPSGDQAQLPCPGDGLGAVGRAELGQEMADVLLDGVEGYHKLARAMAWFDRPEASMPSTSSSRAVSASTRPGTAAAAPGLGSGVACDASNARCSRARQPNGTFAAASPARWTAISRQQRGHRRALVGEDPDITLRAGRGERPGQGGHRGGFLAAGAGGAAVEGRVRSRYPGAMLLHAFGSRAAAPDVLAAAAGGLPAAGRLLAAVSACFALGKATTEQFKHLAAAEAGPLAGLAALPDLRTLRPALAGIADRTDPLRLQRMFASAMLAADPVLSGVYYIDDHFVPYTGAKPVGKGWNNKRGRAEKGRADTHVTAHDGGRCAS